MIRHNLYEIDLEHKTAFCTACGQTNIHVGKSRTGRTPKVICINRFRERNQPSKNRKSEERRLRPGWKPRHSLSEIDGEKMTAICSECGQIEIRKRTDGDSTRYLCANKERAYMRKYRRSHYTSRISSPLLHSLSEIDEENKTAICSRCGPVPIYIWQGKRKMGRRCSNASVENVPEAQKIRREINTDLINRYKVEHGCQRCGYNENPPRLYLYNRDANKKELQIEKLLKLTRKDLMQELKNCEVLCVTRHRLARNEPA